MCRYAGAQLFGRPARFLEIESTAFWGGGFDADAARICAVGRAARGLPDGRPPSQFFAQFCAQFRAQFFAQFRAQACLGIAQRYRRPSSTPPRVHSLPIEQAAQELPVLLRAVVTYYDPYIDLRHGALFVHDASGGVFVMVPLRPILPIQPGSLVEVSGVSAPGDYAAVVDGSRCPVDRPVGLPPNPPRVTLTRIADRRLRQPVGQGRRPHPFSDVRTNNVVLGIATSEGVLSAITLRQPGVNYGSLVDSLVRIEGNSAPLFNLHRQMVGVHLFFPSLREVTVLEPAPRDPFAVPAVPLSDLFRFSPDPALLHRVHVQGTVTLDWPGRELCIQDAKAGICIQTTQQDDRPGWLLCRCRRLSRNHPFQARTRRRCFSRDRLADCLRITRGHFARSGCPKANSAAISTANWCRSMQNSSAATLPPPILPSCCAPAVCFFPPFCPGIFPSAPRFPGRMEAWCASPAFAMCKWIH